MQAKLVVVGGESNAQEIKLRLPMIVGRGKGAKLQLPHALVSRQHCELFESDGKLMVRDLGSLNGTFVNNERITEAAVPSGQLLTIGAVTFRAIYENDEAVLPPDMNRTVEMSTPAAVAEESPELPVPVEEFHVEEVAAVEPVDEVAAVADLGPIEFAISDEEVEVVEEAELDLLLPPGAETLPVPEAASPSADDEKIGGDDDLGFFLKSLGQK